MEPPAMAMTRTATALAHPYPVPPCQAACHPIKPLPKLRIFYTSNAEKRAFLFQNDRENERERKKGREEGRKADEK